MGNAPERLAATVIATLGGQERKLLSCVGDAREWAVEERARYPGLYCLLRGPGYPRNSRPEFLASKSAAPSPSRGPWCAGNVRCVPDVFYPSPPWCANPRQ
jgi:hypothetical protein